MRARVLQGAAWAVLATVVNLAVLNTADEAALPGILTLLLLVACAGGGAVGGVVYYFTESHRRRGGWRTTVANVATLLSYCGATLGLGGLAAWVWVGLRQ